MYAEIRNPAELEKALQLSNGCYQSAILTGSEALSGATLRGKAKRYGDRYARSAASILARCQSAGLAVRESRGLHNKRIVVIG
jgi:hypothetical protein